MKKTLAIILSIIMTFSTLAVSAAAQDEFVANPTVYIQGQGGYLSEEKFNPSDEKCIYPIEIPDGYVGDACKELALPLASALVTDDWTEYGNLLKEKITPFTDPIKCDNNGDAIGGSGESFRSSQSPVTTTVYFHNAQGNPNYKIWYFSYDWRLDPVALGRELGDYIDNVLKKTGAEKVNIVARCLGANIVISYINENGIDKIDDCIFCSSGFEGYELLESVFDGTYDVDGAALERFTDTYLSGDDYGDDRTMDLIRDVVTCLNYGPTLGYSSDVVAAVLNGLRDKTMPELLRESFATMPSFWSYLSEGSYEKAKEYIFGGFEEKYAGLIEKTDYFHYNILEKYDEILGNAVDNGLKLYNIAKYGYQFAPLTGDDKTMSDTMVSTYSSSMGATCTEVDKAFSSAYLLTADSKFISPDKQIDASTCLVPEHTWFIKGISHKNMPASIETIYMSIICNEGYISVFDNEDFPQYLTPKDDEALIPLTEKNAKITVNPDKDNKTINALISLLGNVIILLVNVILKYLGSTK